MKAMRRRSRMRVLLTAGSAIAVTAALAIGPPVRSAALAAEELVVNGTFATGSTDPWWNTDNTTMGLDSGRLRVDVPGGTAEVWDAMAGQSGIPLVAGAGYTLTFEASADGPVSLHARVQEETEPYTGTLDERVTLDTATQSFSFPFTSGLDVDNGQVLFQLGGNAQDATVYLDNISLTTTGGDGGGGETGSPLDLTDGFYVDPDSNPQEWVDLNPGSENAGIIQEAIADQPMARWFGDWPPGEPSAFVEAADAANRLPILVAYNMYNRDCGGASEGGAGSPAEYRTWISDFAAGIGDHPAIVVLEPDALSQSGCVDDTRLGLLRYATERLGALPNTWTYLDAGNFGWPGVDVIAPRLAEAGLDNVRGFSVNVSNFYTTEQSISYGNDLNAAMGTDVPFLIDTSRNGRGHNGDWCNPVGRGLGVTSRVGDQIGSGAELLLWVKVPGDSDGNVGDDCDDRDVPPAGEFNEDLAMELINNAPQSPGQDPSEPGDPGEPGNGSANCGEGCTTIWPASATPADTFAQDEAALELGVRFQVEQAGAITGVRFYKGDGDSAAHVGTLWAGDGNPLAEVTFTAESETGWQEASFAEPVRVSPNTTYVASYHSPLGIFAYDNDYFADSGAGSGPVRALASGVDGPNAVFVYSDTPAFPTESYRDRNYWVDVMFAPDDPGDPTAEFPNASNTGVPPGTDLEPSGSLTITEDGTVIDALDIDGCVTVQADDVTIKRTRIRCASWYPIHLVDGYEGLLVEDVEIDGLNSPDGVAIAHENYTIRRANIHHVSDGPRVGDNTVVEDSYIHHLTNCSDEDDCHNDGIQSLGGSGIRIRGNTIQHPNRQTSCILLGEENEYMDDAIIEDNLLNGGNYTIYAGYGSTDPNIIIRDNHFGRDFVYGLLSEAGQANVDWHGNVWHDTGEPIPKP